MSYVSNPTPDVSCKFGAPMGRHTGPDYLDTTNRLQLVRIRLDAGGYDAGGAYWGHHQRLYYAADDCGNSKFFRARDRDHAKAVIRDTFPDARFFR